MIRQAGALLGIAACLVACGGGELEESIPLDAGGSLRIDIDFGRAESWNRGSIVVTAHEEPEVRLEAQASGWGTYGVELRVEGDEKQVALVGRVGAPLYALFGGPALSVRARLPRGASLDVRSIGAPVELRGILGAVRAEARHEDVELIGASGPVEIVTARGNVRVEEIEGDVRIRSSRGSLAVTAVNGHVDALTEYGAIRIARVTRGATVRGEREQIEMREISGAIRVASQDGAIDLTEISGPIEATSREGTIRARFTGDPEGTLKSDSGRIHVELPSSARLDLDARTIRGGLRLDGAFWLEGELGKRRAVGQINGGGESLRLDSRRGSIDVDTR